MTRTMDARHVDIASARTPRGAGNAADLLRAEGIEATVRLDDAGVGRAFWPIAVPPADAARARSILREAIDAGAIRLAYCPSCRYSLDGLEEVERCPECGTELGEVRARVRMVAVHGEEPADWSGPRRVAPVIRILPWVALVGLIAAAIALTAAGGPAVVVLIAAAAGIVWLTREVRDTQPAA